MNTIIDTDTDQFMPDQALLFRKGRGSDSAIMADVLDSGALARLRTVSGSDVAATVLSSFKSADSRLGGAGFSLDTMTASELVFCDNRTIVFADKGGDRAPLHMRGAVLRSIRISWPPLIYVWTGSNSLSVFAYNGRSVTPDTKLYHAPLFNIGGGGDVCIGNADMPTSFVPNRANWKLIRGVMRDTSFSHVNHDHTIKSDKSVRTPDLVRFWDKQAKTGQRISLKKHLVPMGKTLAQVIGARQ